MPDLLHSLALGFGIALSPTNLFLCLTGVIAGTLIGVLPGVGLLAIIAMLLPVTYGLTAAGALIMLAGICFGAQYGGSTASILVNIPGKASSVITTLDGHQMARQGRAGPALAIAAIGSFSAGCIAAVLVAVLGEPLTSAARVPFTAIALLVGPAEYFALMAFALCFAVVLTRGPVIKAAAMVMLGLQLSIVGSDIETGQSRMSFDIPELSDGIGFLTVVMGLFALAEILRNLEQPGTHDIVKSRLTGLKLTGLMPARADLKSAAGAVARGTVLGSVLGALPGGGPVIAAFLAYIFEKKVSNHPERFGHGAIEGVAAPESANNAAAQTSFIPLFALGIAPNAVMALVANAMTVHGILPGPLFAAKQPELFWGLAASMLIANLMLIVINLPMAGMWARLLQVPYRLIFPAILILCLIGVYSINNSPFDCVILAALGLIGYWLVRLGFEPAPMLLGFVYGPLMEENLRRTMLIARGDPTAFVARPISLALLCIAAVLLAVAMLPVIARKRDEAFAEGSDVSPSLAPHRPARSPGS